MPFFKFFFFATNMRYLVICRELILMFAYQNIIRASTHTQTHSIISKFRMLVPWGTIRAHLHTTISQFKKKKKCFLPSNQVKENVAHVVGPLCVVECSSQGLYDVQ